MLKRDPKGRFIWRGQALRAWLPTLLDVAPAWDAGTVEFVLDCTARFCDRAAIRRFENAAQACRETNSGWCDIAVKYAQQWRRIAAIIRRATEEIKEEVA